MGGSSGGSAHTPVEALESGRSKQRVKIVEVISEGEIGGLVEGLKSVYLDNTPIQNADSSYNFTNVETEGRTGTQDQDVMSNFNTTEKEISVAAEVKKTIPLTRTVTDGNVTQLRLTLGVQSLFKQESNGDTNGTAVDFKITVGAAEYHLNINGKYSSQYLRAMIIDNLPQVPFTVRVERLTDDSNSQRVQDKTIWASYTEIIDTDFAYPNTAYIGIKFDSEYFSNIPNRTYEVYGIKVKVPSNYDPMTRQYTGLWDGTFKIAWTNNPAWVLLDVLTNKRYGLGERLGDFSVDKWALYAIAQYCDQLVPDGYGKMEPRFTCNLWLTEQRSAYDVISDLCSIFRAIPVWNGTEMTFIIDRPADPVWTYTNANVIKGEFTRQYSAKKARHNAIQVEYKDKENNYQTTIEYISDDDSIRKNGFNLQKVTAVGCTTRGQAYRTGRWILETEKLETESVTFSVGAEGLMHIPGDIIRVTDNHFAGTNLGGRVISVKGKDVTVDREITLPANSYFSYINAEAKHTAIKIIKIEKGTQLTLESVPAGLKEYDVYSISNQQVTSRLYRCMTITEDDGIYTITALQHEPQKEAIVDNGASFEPLATSLLSGGLQKVSNADVSLSENGVEISFDYAANTTTAVKYQVKLFRNGELYRQLVDVTNTKLTFTDLPDGVYTVEIRAKNSNGQLSDPITRTFEINLRIPQLITKSLLFAIELDWELPKTATVGNYTELWRATENDVSKAVKIATVPYPQNTFTINGVSLSESYYFFARCGDKAGNKGEFTEGVFGEADHNPDTLLNALEGQITQSHLGKNLIESLQADIDVAVGEEATQRKGAVANALAQILAETQARTAAIAVEANNRTKAIQAESANLTKKIQDEAKARGTAVIQLQQTDAQQAQLITAVTAKADQAIAGLQDEKTARAEADKAEAQARNLLTSRVASAESGIAEVRQSIATANSSIAEVSQNMNAKIDELSVGGRNLLRNSKSEYTGNRYTTTYSLASIPAVGEMVTVTLWGQLAADRQAFAVYNTHGFRELAQLKKVRDGVYSATFAWNQPLNNREEKDNSLSTHLNVYAYPRTATSDNVITQVKLERGTISTDWTPAPEDTDSTISAVSADLTSYKQAQAIKEQATAQQISGLTTRMASAESGISRVEKAVSDNQSATAIQLNQLNSKMSNAESGISSLQTAMSQANNSIAQTSQNLNAKIDGLQVGGRNLLRNTTFSDSSYWRYTKQTNSDSVGRIENGELVWASNNVAPMWQQWQQTSYEWGGLAPNLMLEELNKGDTFTISFEYKSTTNFNFTAALAFDPTSGKRADTATIIPVVTTENWVKHTVTLTISVNKQDNFRGSRLILNAGQLVSGEFRVRKIKLEKGTIATDWTPALEDADSAISAVSADLTNYKSAQATKELATAQQVSGLAARVATSESNISNMQSTKASKDEVASLAQQSLQSVWQADAQAKVDSIAVGGRNLLRNSKSEYTGNRYTTTYSLASIPAVGEMVTVTLWGQLAADRQAFAVYNTHGFRELAQLKKVRDGVYTATFMWRNPLNGSEEKENDLSTHLNIYAYPRTATSDNTIKQVKLEIGSIATDWTPAPEDVESAINAVSSKVDSVQHTLTTENQALGTRIDTVTASINDTKAQVSQVSNAVAGIDGRLSATSTLKTQVIAGGRKAIAGIALGAESDGKTAESSVIVMADKFGIVANANDGNVKPVFSVANGQVGIRGDLVVAGSVTNDKLSSGSGENLLTNPIFANPTNGVPYGWSLEGNATTKNCECFQDQDWGLKKNGYLPNENILKYSSANDAGATTYFSIVQLVPVIANKWYMASAYIGNHRSSKVELIIQYIRSDNTAISATHLIAGSGYAFAGINNAERAKIKFKAPSDCVAINFYLRKAATSLGNTNSYMFVARPMLEECTEHATEPSPWANSGVTAVHGGSIIANTIRGEHIQANQRISAPIINGGSLNINNKFIVSSDGNVEIRSAAGNVGMIIRNDRIDVYDEWGNLQVRLGKLR